MGGPAARVSARPPTDAAKGVANGAGTAPLPLLPGTERAPPRRDVPTPRGASPPRCAVRYREHYARPARASAISPRVGVTDALTCPHVFPLLPPLPPSLPPQHSSDSGAPSSSSSSSAPVLPPAVQAAFSAALAQAALQAQQQSAAAAASSSLPSAPSDPTAALAAAAAAAGLPLPAYIQQQQAMMAAALVEMQRQGYAAPPTLPTSAPVRAYAAQPPPAPPASSSSSAAAAAHDNDSSFYSTGAAAGRSSRRERARSRSIGSARGSLSPSLNGTAAAAEAAAGGNPASEEPPMTARARSARKNVTGAGELEECTFHPKVAPLPPQYTARRSLGGSGAVPFQDRVIAWERQKREEARRQAEERAARDLEECTFQPAINTTSREVAAARGYGAGPGAQEIHERLYKQGTASKAAAAAVAAAVGRPGTASGLYDPSTGTTAGRLSLLATGRPLFTSGETGSPGAPLDRKHLIESDAQQQQALAHAAAVAAAAAGSLAECTFHPKVNPVVDARPVRSRYRDPTPTRSASRPRPAPSGTEECTFRPKTNPVRAEAMPAAALYVQAPIYDRLARTQTRSQKEREAAVADDTRRAHEAHEQAAADGVAGGAGGNQSRARSSSVDRGAGAESVTSEEREERARRLSDFLARQEAAVRKREAAVAIMREATAPPLQPALCEKSLRIVQERALGPFLDRITHDKLVKEQVVRIFRPGERPLDAPSPLSFPLTTSLLPLSPPPPTAGPPHKGDAQPRPRVHLPPRDQRVVAHDEGAVRH
jgi:hypothetical protein